MGRHVIDNTGSWFDRYSKINNNFEELYASVGSAGSTGSTVTLPFIDVRSFGAVGNGTTNDTAAIQAAINSLGASGGSIAFPAGTYKITDTLVVGGNRPFIEFDGAASQGTTLLFVNTVTNKPLISLTPETTHVTFKNFIFEDSTRRTSEGVRIAAWPQTQAFVNWKNLFVGCQFLGFKIGVEFTTNGSTTNGAQQDWVDTNTFVHCEWFDCETSVLNNNQQAFCNNFYNCSLLVGYSGHQTSSILVRDNCGGSMNFFGATFITSGRLYVPSFPAGATTIWNHGAFGVYGGRIEVRNVGGGYGSLIEEDLSWDGLWFRDLTIYWRDVKILSFLTNFNLLHYAGRMEAFFDNIQVLGGTAIIKQHPVQGFSGSWDYGSSGSIKVIHSSGVKLVTDYANTWGTTGPGFSNRMEMSQTSVGSYGANASYVADAQGFLGLYSYDAEVLGLGLGSISSKKIVYNNNDTQWGIGTSAKIKLPPGGRPAKFFFYKHPLNFAANVQWQLYLVKDVALWQNNTAFNVSTDAFLVADTGVTTNKAGYFEVPIVLTNNAFGTDLISGTTSWTEGRLYAATVGAVTAGGFVGVEYY